MTSPTPELMTAEYMHPGYRKMYPIQTVLRDLASQEHADGEPYDAMKFASHVIDALHERLAASNAKIAELEAGASRSLFALMTNRALAAEARADAAEARELQQSAGIPHLPTQLTYECRLAISGEGPRACDWTDKPHRLVYDLCREIERIAALETGESTPVAWMGREGYFTTDPRQASAHAHHGTPLTPLYTSKV